ncbi:hypothetical protein BO94DRAFT_575555 [Aspergillus sclerotioniger CBS 115572]|uniref:Protein kinase domain-containing protein n=1 Tax=Aspergillus sclerotioniger CBS 115572 TaxID=1450535 RepID=A0A317WJE1_9EURO|nr:hypothetical protein BO94DRAFT_575555 [Aspergillus sclerotioniger CBS 115572]PWY86483.1 hypothetical protein BO94DRAFT_575555 [Aspergillus sclerotioniger CBS 115572]
MHPKHQSWTDTFFSGCQTPFDIGEIAGDDLRLFTCNNKPWRFGKLVRQDAPLGGPILVLWFFPTTQKKKHKLNLGGSPQNSILSRTSKRELDPFLNETRAFDHIDRLCPPSRRAFFPRFHGVITNIKRSEFPPIYKLRRRAVVLEAIVPDIACRRLLAAESYSVLVDNFALKLKDLPLSVFEIEWYRSLFENRLRRVNALHDIGIVHGDIRDDHFRIPGDSYDTVLYDFSNSYTFSPRLPYRVASRKALPLSKIRQYEEGYVSDQVYRRAQQMDLRDHLAKSLQTNIDAVEAILSCPLDEAKDLELIVLKTTNRPDGFTVPSLTSVFPFLEAIRPKSNPSWHISRARQLKSYKSLWAFQHTHENQVNLTKQTLTIVSLWGEMLTDPDKLRTEQGCFFLLLVPHAWVIDDVGSKLLAACIRVSEGGSPGGIISRSDFEDI